MGVCKHACEPSPKAPQCKRKGPCCLAHIKRLRVLTTLPLNLYWQIAKKWAPPPHLLLSWILSLLLLLYTSEIHNNGKKWNVHSLLCWLWGYGSLSVWDTNRSFHLTWSTTPTYHIWGMYSGILPAVQTYWQFIFNSSSCYRCPMPHVIICFLHTIIPC